MEANEIQSLLVSVSYMCLQSIEKSKQLKNKFDRTDLSIEEKNRNINSVRTLLNRMSGNINEFQDKFESIINQCAPKIENTTVVNTPNLIKNEKLSRLSLIKSRPDSLEEYDIDLTGSVATKLKENILHNYNTNIKVESKQEDDSENGTIILEEDKHEEEAKEFEAQIAIKHEQRAEEYHRENSELLKVFMELPVKQDYDVENAFKFMDELDIPSTDSGDTILYSSDDLSSDNRDNGNKNDDKQSSDGTIDENKLAIVEKSDNYIVKVQRLDNMNDGEIDRLCNLNNIKKRKLRKTVKRLRKLKRVKPETSDSYTSDSSINTGNTSNPALADSTDDKDSDLDFSISDSDETNNNNNTNNNVNNKDLLAEMFCNEGLSDSLKESDTDDSDLTEIDERKRKKLRNRKTNNQNRKKRKQYSPLPDIPSDSDSTDIDGEIHKKTANTQQSDNETNELGNVTVIGDSDSSSVEFLDDDSDLELISEVQSDLSNTSGRKQIRRILSADELTQATQQARFEESQRIQRLEELAKIKEPLLSQHDNLILDMDVKTKSPLVVVSNRLYRKLKPHQKDGVKFMWEACYESIDAINNGKSGSGCILAHCMGLGKTFQAITLIHTVLTHAITKTKQILVICPLSTVLNWKNEFELAFKLLDKLPNYQIHYIVKETLTERCNIIEKWHKDGGVLVMGYDAFVRIICYKPEDIRRDHLKKLLTDPGPDLVICDEGHLLKNEKAKRSGALMSIKTNRKIVLTGTPLQNNLKEYYYMVTFVKPGILGTFSEYNNRFVNPIMNGQFHDSDLHDIKLMKKRTHVLNKLLKKTIHRAESSILKQYLPSILDYTIFIKLEPLQIDLYQKFVDYVRQDMRNRQFFRDYRILQYIGLHPYIIELNKKENKKNRKERDTINVEEEEDVGNIPIDWWSNGPISDLSKQPHYGPKIQIIFSIIDECELVRDKVLIFSHSLVELDCIEHYLKTCGTKNRSQWVRDVDYFRLDGTVAPALRINLCNRFNCEMNKTMVFMVSQKVGGLGLNLIAANRVILVSTNFNPGYDTQSVYRMYRFGQHKRCYVYRLVTMGTMEEKIYQRCILKLSLAGTVIDKFHIARHIARHDFFNTMYNLDIENYNQHPIPNVPNDRILAKLLQTISSIYKYNEYQALLENLPEEELNDEEKKLAWEEYNNEENAPKNAEVVPPLLHHQPVPRFVLGGATDASVEQSAINLENLIRRFNTITQSNTTTYNRPDDSPSASNSSRSNNLPIANRPKNIKKPTNNYNRFQNNASAAASTSRVGNNSSFSNDRAHNNSPSTNKRKTTQNIFSVNYSNPNENVPNSSSVDTNGGGFFVRDRNSLNQHDFLLNRFYK